MKIILEIKKLEKNIQLPKKDFLKREYSLFRGNKYQNNYNLILKILFLY